MATLLDHSRGRGLCMAVFYLVPVSKVGLLIPPQLKVIEVLPGYTVGGIYAAKYPAADLSSTSEFGVLPAYVRFGEKKGYFMHHFSVDVEPGSGQVAPGADTGASSDCNWEITENKIELTVYTGGRPMIQVKLRPLLQNLPFSASIPFLCAKGENVMFMKNQFASNIGISMSSVSIPKGSPLKGFPFRFKLLSTYWDASNVVQREQEYLKGRVLTRADEAFGSPVGKGACKGFHR